LKTLSCAATLLLLAALAAPLPAQEEPIDWTRARGIHDKAQRGETLTPAEQQYYERAKAARRAGQPPGPSAATVSSKWSEHLTPLTELGTGKYKGEDGGLYGEGRNQPPELHLKAALNEAARIQPLDAQGKPASEGKIVVLSVGMSNTTMEYSQFKRLADADPQKARNVVIVDGAQGGQTGTMWADAKARVWPEVENRLKSAGVSARQVQVVWIKQAEAGPARLGEFPAHARTLSTHLASALNLLKEKFPNLRIAYLSSRIYAGYATTPLNPEPYSYESAFAIRWLIQDQIKGQPQLNYDPARGEVKAPLLLWGPYLWADGETPRKVDGLVYKREDLSDRDGTHPSPSGRDKVAQALLKFLKTDSTARPWFVGAL
jgi:hypothetical protein